MATNECVCALCAHEFPCPAIAICPGCRSRQVRRKGSIDHVRAELGLDEDEERQRAWRALFKTEPTMERERAS